MEMHDEVVLFHDHVCDNQNNSYCLLVWESKSTEIGESIYLMILIDSDYNYQ